MDDESEAQEVVKDLTELLNETETTLTENPANHGIKFSLDLVKAMLYVKDLYGVSYEDGAMLEQRYDSLQVKYDAIVKNARILDCS